MEIILASTSPRRKSLLAQAGVKFEIVSPDFDEKFENLDFSFDKIEDVSRNKALSVINKVSADKIILSADTVVVFENKILLKPKNEAKAFEMLKQLSGNEHFVVTTYTLTCPKTKKIITKHVKSYVKFAELTDEQINKYIKDFQPLDKAGAYGLQELPEYFHPQVKGSKSNIIGLPVEEILEDLKTF